MQKLILKSVNNYTRKTCISHDICILVRLWNMKNANLYQDNLFMEKVNTEQLSRCGTELRGR